MLQRIPRLPILGLILLCGVLSTMSACRQENAPRQPVESVQEPAVDQTAVEEPVVDEPMIEEPAVEEPAVDEPAVEKPAIEDPAVDEAGVEESRVEEPVVDEPAAGEKPPVEPSADEEPDMSAQSGLEPPTGTGIVRLTKDYDLWIDPEKKLVFVDGEVCLREGQLEMFACPKGTKEHESIVAVNCPARFIHAALEAVGAKAGQAVQFDPEYRPATGPIIDVNVQWKDRDGQQHETPAQEWIQEGSTGKAMDHSWVFAGSGFWTDEQSGERHYQADGGDLICVSNFPSATLDLPIESSQANTALLFSAFTEQIPPLDTKVRLVLTPRKAE